MRLLADYVFDSDFCLPEDEPALVITGPDGSFTLTLSNTSDDPLLAEGVLAGRLVFEAPSLAEAKTVAEDHIGRFLNAAAYVTGHSFAYNSLRQIIDWSPGVSMRSMHKYIERPLRETAEPVLDNRFGSSIGHFIVVQSGERQQTALRWFRRGLTSTNLEDQFIYFWFALEIAAEISKGPEKVPSACPHCRGPLFCESCNKQPMHRPYSGQAIKQIFRKLTGEEDDQLFNELQKIRHTLMHGDRIGSVIDSLALTEDEAINALAQITHEALLGTFTAKNEQPPPELVLASRTDVTRKRLIMTADMAVGMGGNIDDPQIADIPDVKVTMEYSPRRKPAQDSG
jgi:hypothetical protein